MSNNFYRNMETKVKKMVKIKAATENKAKKRARFQKKQMNGWQKWGSLGCYH